MALAGQPDFGATVLIDVVMGDQHAGHVIAEHLFEMVCVGMG